MLNTFDPSMFPSAIWSLCLDAATMLEASSGMEVPPASTVVAMNLSLTPMALASSVAFFSFLCDLEKDLLCFFAFFFLQLSY